MDGINGGLRCYVCLIRGLAGQYAVTLVRGTAVCEKHISADEVRATNSDA